MRVGAVHGGSSAEWGRADRVCLVSGVGHKGEYSACWQGNFFESSPPVLLVGIGAGGHRGLPRSEPGQLLGPGREGEGEGIAGAA